MSENEVMSENVIRILENKKNKQEHSASNTQTEVVSNDNTENNEADDPIHRSNENKDRNASSLLNKKTSLPNKEASLPNTETSLPNTEASLPNTEHKFQEEQMSSANRSLKDKDISEKEDNFVDHTAPVVPKANQTKTNLDSKKSLTEKTHLKPFESFTRDSLDATNIRNTFTTRQSTSSGSDIFSITSDSENSKKDLNNDKSSTDVFPNKKLPLVKDEGLRRYSKKKRLNESIDNEQAEGNWICKSKIPVVFALSLATLLFVSISAVILVASTNQRRHNHFHGENPLPDEKTVEKYQKAAVVTGSPKCSEIGADILRKSGSAVDAAIASCLCMGVINKHSSGIGGGGFMLVYNRSSDANYLSERFVALDFRESAPGKATQTMFENDKYRIGGKTIAVPGEIKGLHYAHVHHGGKLQWRYLVEPAIYLARNGFSITERTKRITNVKKKMIQEDVGLRRIMLGSNNEPRPTGFVVKDELLAKTLEEIRDDPESFYTGKLAERIVKDVQQAGGLITLDDLANYNVKKRRVIRESIGNLKFFTTGAPAGGVVVAQILNILKNDRLKRADVNYDDLNRVGLTYHRILEAMKFAFAKKAGLGDPDFSDGNVVYKLVDSMVNDTEGEIINSYIDNESTHNSSYYNLQYTLNYDYGTSHINVLAENGDAVSLTSSINDWFGAGFRSTETGITYNNQMIDFSLRRKSYTPTLPLPTANMIHSGKRPASSMAQIIMTDEKGNPIFVIGGAGGGKIIPAVALTIINKLWFGDSIENAINRKRFYTTLFPNRVRAERTDKRDQKLISILRSKNHVVSTSETLQNAEVLAVFVEKDGTIHVSTDVRRHSHSDGYK